MKPLFLECDREGNVLWMSGRTRARLGPVANLLACFTEQVLPEAVRFLAGESDRSVLTGRFRRSDRKDELPVRVSRVLASGDRLLLSAEVWERTSDAVPPEEQETEALTTIQGSMVRNYFRLRRAKELLEERSRRTQRDPAVVLLERLEQERTRLGRELHAGAGQALAGIKLHLEVIQAALENPPEPVAGSLHRIGLLAQDALQQLRTISQRLQPPEWQRLKLAEALEILWKTTGIPQRFEATLELHAPLTEPSPALKIVLYRVAQEALSNVIRHSGATRIRLSLEHREGLIWLTVEDNGRGFDTTGFFAKALSPAEGMGLRSIQDQVQAFNGEFEIRSGPGGTQLVVSLPMTED